MCRSSSSTTSHDRIEKASRSAGIRFGGAQRSMRVGIEARSFEPVSPHDRRGGRHFGRAIAFGSFARAGRVMRPLGHGAARLVARATRSDARGSPRARHSDRDMECRLTFAWGSSLVRVKARAKVLRAIARAPISGPTACRFEVSASVAGPIGAIASFGSRPTGREVGRPSGSRSQARSIAGIGGRLQAQECRREIVDIVSSALLHNVAVHWSVEGYA